MINADSIPLHKVPGPLKKLLSEFYAILAVPSEDRTPENNARIAAIVVEFSRFSHDEDCRTVIADALGDAMRQSLQSLI